MPFYVWCCDEEGCPQTDQTFEHKPKPRPALCSAGHGAMVRDWHAEAGGHVPGSTWPMVTTHLTGKREEFSDQAALNRRLKELGMRQRDDTSFLDKTYEGYDMVNGRQKHSEGSGRGNPGQWV